jgi:hypothetical protein
MLVAVFDLLVLPSKTNPEEETVAISSGSPSRE